MEDVSLLGGKAKRLLVPQRLPELQRGTGTFCNSKILEAMLGRELLNSFFTNLKT